MLSIDSDLSLSLVRVFWHYLESLLCHQTGWWVWGRKLSPNFWESNLSGSFVFISPRYYYLINSSYSWQFLSLTSHTLLWLMASAKNFLGIALIENLPRLPLEHLAFGGNYFPLFGLDLIGVEVSGQFLGFWTKAAVTAVCLCSFSPVRKSLPLFSLPRYTA